MEIILSSMKKSVFSLLLLLLSILLYSCVEKECLASKEVLVGVAFVQDATGELFTLDSISVQAQGLEGVLYDNEKNVSTIYLPLKAVDNATTYTLLLNDTPTVFTIQHQNTPQLLSMECGSVVFHYIDTASLVGESSISVDIIHPNVENKKNEIHLRIRL